MESYGEREAGNVFGTYHWATEAGHDLHCGGSTPERRCAPYNFSGRFPGEGVPADFSAALGAINRSVGLNAVDVPAHPSF